MINVSFPGIGIGEFSIDPVAFTIPIFGGLEVRWYGIIITCGIVLAFLYAYYRSKQEGVSFDALSDIAIYTVIFAIIGARAYYVLTSLDKYDGFLDMIAIWNGGLAIYGALIAGAITVFVCCRIKKLNFFKLADAVAPGVMIGQILGRWGNFFNGEAHGGIVLEGSPLYFIRMGLSSHNISGVYGTAYVHPTFLYESLWNLCGFLIIHFLYKKKKFDGQILLMYVTWYGFGRMLIEGLRTDSLYVGVFRISQVVGFICFAVGGVLLIYFLVKARRAELTARAYEAAYPKFATSASASDTVAVEEQTDKADESRANETDQGTAAEDDSSVDAPLTEQQATSNDEAEDETAEETAEASDTREYTDISDKLSRLFGDETDNDTDKN